MVTKEEAKREIKKLIERFDQKSPSELKTMNEETVKKNFILPLFKQLGWDVDSDDVSAEEDIFKKRVDYGFKANGITKFFLEAKKPSEDILNDTDHIRQAINYSYWKSVTWAVLTNFKELVVFNAEWKNNNLSENRFITLNYKEFIEKFDKLWLLSTESFEKNTIDEEATVVGKKQKREPIGEQILEDLIKWRESLTKNIDKYDHKLDQETLDEAVQRILDRLIFIKSCEDRGIESHVLLPKSRQWEENWRHAKKTLLEELNLVFRYFDNKYNSRLFEPHVCETLKIDNEVINQIIKELHGDESGLVKYDFSVIPSDILGNIYEQYLGHILKKSKKSAKVIEKHAHRKEQGIYYTPTYIVDYIVKNTVREHIKDKDVDEILDTKILDPACGSGSFLIKAYSTLLDVVKEKMRVGERSKKWVSLKSYSGRLNINQKIVILTSCIHGVDLDKKAVEIAQLNLLLKLLEGETPVTLSNIKEIKKLLPMLNDNIKCGNSLIDDKKYSDNKTFVWEREFKEIMDSGGFEVVIGNPPYINMQTLKDFQKYCEVRYPEIYTGQNDILYYFVLRGLNVLKNEGRLGFIISRYFLESSYANKFRKFILDDSVIETIIDFNNFQVFGRDVNVLTSIIILRKENIELERRKSNVKIIKLKDYTGSGHELINHIYIKTTNKEYSNRILDIFEVKQSDLTGKSWSLSNSYISTLKSKIDKSSIALDKLCYVGKGMETGLNEAFVIDNKIESEGKIERHNLRNYVKTRDLKRFVPLSRNLKIIYIPKKLDENKNKNTLRHLQKWQVELKQRFDFKNKHCEWYSWGNLRNRELFESDSEKIITPLYSTSNKFVYDSGKSDENYYTLTDTYIIVPKSDIKISLKYLIALLNSKLIEFYFKNTAKLKRDGYYEYSGGALSKIPIKHDKKIENKLISLVDKILYLKKSLINLGDNLTDEKTKLEKEVKEVDREINEIVYDIYGMTKDERAIIEKIVE
ncbi:MAG: hypothetical protein QT00_C0001G0169 [archaeon GW2011_AR5]|nr:MAG: hypothetical protein QT00_C0001G0169 [archaeon GW2011_AR5]